MGNTAVGVPANKQKSKAAIVAGWLGLVAALLLVVAGPGYRLHLWGLTALLTVPIAFLIGIVAVILALIGIRSSTTKGLAGRGIARVGLLSGLVAVGLSTMNILGAVRNPIHDVTTDTVNPPQFSAVLPLRTGPAINPVTYDEKTAREQHKVYPDIAPLDLNVSPSQAYDRALAAARAMGWEIVASDPAQGRIEATATTLLYGFKDDVAIRIAPSASGSRVDVRSLSRIGQSDVGANARRVRAYLAKIRS
ncbi:MAG TPA: DUF1499 domain-containing protein [Candidatus Saccharimonadales bacterium]|nr:DUF1499 domain-containing protein [Candidatus Saccharimonadales bacterium]